MRADESAADLYEQQSELFDSLLQNPATKKQPKSSRAAHIKELDVKVAQLNRDYDAKKHANAQKKAKVHQKKVHAKVQKKTKASDTMPREMMFLQEDSSLSKKEKRAAQKKEIDVKVAKLNRDYAKKHAKKAKVHQKKVHAKVQKKTKASDTMPREMMFLQEDSSLSKKEKRAA